MYTKKPVDLTHGDFDKSARHQATSKESTELAREHVRKCAEAGLKIDPSKVDAFAEEETSS